VGGAGWGAVEGGSAGKASCGLLLELAEAAPEGEGEGEGAVVDRAGAATQDGANEGAGLLAPASVVDADVAAARSDGKSALMRRVLEWMSQRARCLCGSGKRSTISSNSLSASALSPNSLWNCW
jgi:hypothetical protein